MLVLERTKMFNKVLQLLCLVRLQAFLLLRYLPKLVDQIHPLLFHPLHDLLAHGEFPPLLRWGLLGAAAEVGAGNIQL